MNVIIGKLARLNFNSVYLFPERKLHWQLARHVLLIRGYVCIVSRGVQIPRGRIGSRAARLLLLVHMNEIIL